MAVLQLLPISMIFVVSIQWSSMVSAYLGTQRLYFGTDEYDMKKLLLEQQSLIETMGLKIQDHETKIKSYNHVEQQMILQAEKIKHLEQVVHRLERNCQQRFHFRRNNVESRGRITNSGQQLQPLTDSSNKEKLSGRDKGIELDTETKLCSSKAKRTTEHTTKAKDIAFSARLLTDLSHMTGNINIIFDDVITNVLKAYDNATGIFTAPVDGTYVFICSIVNPPGTKMNSEIYLNSNLEVRILSNAKHSNDDSAATNTVILQMKKGDNVSVKTATTRYHTGDVLGGTYTTFSGWRLF